MAFRMDDRQQRIIVDADGGEGLSFFGWEVADAAALDAVAARLEKAGVSVARGSRALADERRVKDLIVTSDPVGNRLELFHGAETTAEPFKPGRSISGFRTGPLGLGHVVMHTVNTDEMVTFYRDLLGFRLTDYYSHAVQGDVHAPQSAPPQPRLHRDRQERGASHDDGALQLRRRRAGLRHRAGREPRRHHARPPHQRLHHVVLFVDAVELHGGIRLGRPRHRRRELEGLRAQGRPEHVGPRPHLAVEGRPGQGARAAPRQRRQGLPPAGAGDGRQLQPHARRLPVVGPDEGAAVG